MKDAKENKMKHGDGSCHLHGVHRKCSFPQCSNNARKAGLLALKRNSAARTDAPTMPSGRAGGLHQSWCKAQFQTECPYSGDKRRVTYFYRQVNGTPPADPVSPLDITNELSKSNLLQRDCMRLGRAGGELLAESLGDVSVQTMPLCNS